MASSLRLLGHVRFEGTLTAKSGLRIGASRDDIEIGASDNPILRHPLTKLPYIPGSSIKGKLRSLLEYKEGKVATTGREAGQPCGCARDDCLVCILFGPHLKPVHALGPTRILARDATLTAESAGALERLQEDGLMYAEVKTENIVDRRTGVAADRGLRTQERVPAGAVFDFRLTLRMFDGDNIQRHVAFVEEGLRLLQDEYLGGSGSRGYGEVVLAYSHNAQQLGTGNAGR